MKGRLAKYGRHADDLKIMPGVSIFVAKTEAEARAKYDELNSYIHSSLGLSLLQQLGGFTEDLSQYDLDQPLPEHIGQVENGASRQQLILDIARKNNFTIRQLYHGSPVHEDTGLLLALQSKWSMNCNLGLKMKRLMVSISYHRRLQLVWTISST